MASVLHAPDTLSIVTSRVKPSPDVHVPTGGLPSFGQRDECTSVAVLIAGPKCAVVLPNYASIALTIPARAHPAGHFSLTGKGDPDPIFVSRGASAAIGLSGAQFGVVLELGGRVVKISSFQMISDCETGVVFVPCFQVNLATEGVPDIVLLHP